MKKGNRWIEYKNGDKIGLCVYKEERGRVVLDRRALFVCFCGKEFEASISQLKSGKTKSCGCLLTAFLKRRGERVSDFPEYGIWAGMKQRCYMPKCKNYKNYGARGIEVCDRWINSFGTFIADMGRRPTPKHSIERIDNNKNYYPENCKWETTHNQSRNRRNNNIFSFQGHVMTMADWSIALKIPSTRLYDRYSAGWPDNEILFGREKFTEKYNENYKIWQEYLAAI